MAKGIDTGTQPVPRKADDIPLLFSQHADNILTSLLAIDSHSLIVIFNDSGTIIYANEKLCEFTSYDYNELVGTDNSVFNLHGQNHELFAEIREKLLNGESWHGEISMIARDGTPLWCATTMIPIQYEHHFERQYIAISTDITPFKQIEEDAEKRLATLEQAIESISDSFILYDADNRLVYCNQNHLDFFPHLKDLYVPGVKRETIWNAHAEVLREKSSDPNISAYIENRTSKLRASHYDEEAQLIDGRWVATRERSLANGGQVAIRTDITRIKNMMIDLETKSEEAIEMAGALREARDVQKDAIDNITEGFILWDQDDRLVSCNAMVKKIFRDMGDIFHPGLTYEEFVKRGIETGIMPKKYDCYDRELESRTKRHVRAGGHFEEQLSDGRWVRVNQSKASNGRIVAIVTDITDQKRTENAIKQLAETDSLTGLANRNLFSKCIQNSMRAADSSHSSMAILLLDLDHFKMVNDTLGHPVGDALLIEVAKRLENCTRSFDTVSRLGGDEFAVIANGIDCINDITTMADNISASLSKPYNLDGHKVFSSASIGITLYPSDDTDADNLLRNADIALYKAKEAGRGQYKLFDYSMNREIYVRRTIEQGLRKVIETDQLQLYYQPQINVQTGKIVGAEALLRWITPDGYEVPPNEFIPVAEDTGLIEPLCQWVLNTACLKAEQWHSEGLGSITTAVNISAVQFKHQGLPNMVREALDISGLPPYLLELEITEGVAIDHSSTQVFEMVKDLGVKMAIDDFGTGYSSLSQLTNFPVNRLKIDKSFIRAQENMAVCTAIINLGRSLNLGVIAEGVETVDELESLMMLGCHEMQGYLFAPAMPVEEFENFVRTHSPDQFMRSSETIFGSIEDELIVREA